MKKLLKAILEQLTYQTKLMETLVEGTSLGGNTQGKEEAVDNAMDLLLSMPMFNQVDRSKLKAIVRGGG
ncbi:hypothetical protein LCGC14_1068700 [marine sediment metagenome]|uniref:Uncharacterized protein n=1 Tax=marine sediment metagenome TaxID=412755 RepID=A0A0F9MIZ9_9ZZZZ